MSEVERTKTNQPKCRGVRKDGQPCQAPALESGYCFAHCPDRKAQRAAARSKGGQNRANIVRLRGLMPPRLAPVFDQLEAALSEVHSGALAPGRAMAMASVARAMVAVLQAGEMEERLRNVEAQLSEDERRWA